MRQVEPSPEGVRSAVLQVGSQELNVFSHPDSASAGQEKLAGIDHFCLTVESGSIALFVHDPGGVRVELQLRA